MAYLYQQIQNVEGLSGNNSYAKQSDYYNKLGLSNQYGAYKGSYAQNSQLLSYLSKPNYGLPTAQATPASSPVAQVPAPQTQQEMPDYLVNYQQSMKDLENMMSSPMKSDEEIRQEIENQIKPTATLPEIPKLTEMFENLRKDYGLYDIEQQINDLKGIEADIVARRRQRMQHEEGQAVRLSVIGGRQSEINRQEAENIDFVQRQLARKVDQAQGAYTIINTMMQLTQSDYNNSLERYNTEFNQKMQTYQLFQQQKQQNIENKKDLLSIELQEVQRQEAMARANLEIFVNMINDNKMDYGNLDDATKLQLEKMSIQAGLGKDFIKNLGSTDRIVTTDTRQAGNTKYLDMVMRRPDGSVYVKSTKIGASYSASSGGSNKSNEPTDKEVREYMSKASQILADVDTNYQTTYDKNGKVTGTKKLDSPSKGDYQMSEAEADEALERLVRELGDRDLANKVFVEAWKDGGYSWWYPK